MYSRPPLPLLIPFYPLSLVYGAAVRLRNRLYSAGVLKTEKLPCAVVSIGNLTAGGSGKTPVAVCVAGFLRDRGKKVVVLSRGYGGRIKSGVGVVSDGKEIFLGPDEAGDEPFLMARRLPGVPVVVGPRRRKTGRFSIERFSPDFLVLDDGFQHRAVERDLNILLIDSSTGFGNGRLLPMGPLREPLGSVGRADVIMLKGGHEKDAANFHAFFKKPVIRFDYAPGKLTELRSNAAVPLEFLKGKKVVAASGIANPSSFHKTLEALGAECVKKIAFPDHHPYSPRDVERIERAAARSGAGAVITTEKDGVKLERLGAPFYALSINVRIDDPRSFERTFRSLVEGG